HPGRNSGSLHLQPQRSVRRPSHRQTRLRRRAFQLSLQIPLCPARAAESLSHHYDHDAVRHLFRVSAGLESMLLGEAEILGQVREAYLRAHAAHVTGPVLNRLFQAALEVGKRVRAETELGSRPMGVASAGMKLAERIFGKLNDRTALVLGAGTISEQ